MKSGVHPGNQKALVIGGSLAGLLAARVLSTYFEQVTILERDHYPDGPEPRQGVPQARHAHILLVRGLKILEELFPGLRAEMVEAGAHHVDTGQELATLGYHGWVAQYDAGLSMLCFTRPLLDWCIRRRLADQPGISIMDGCRVAGLVGSRDDVAGVRYQSSGEDGVRDHYADFVVDASGRFSRTPDWLAELGYERPPEEVVEPNMEYVTRMYEAPRHSEVGWKALLVLGRPPAQTRGGLLLPVEGQRWLVSLASRGGDQLPSTDAEFLEYARGLRSPALYRVLQAARPLTPIRGYRATSNRLRRFDALSRWPDSLVVLGDAACAFNPLYAQGMTVAALEALALDRCLMKHRLEMGFRDGLGHRYQQDVAGVTRIPWLLATGDDLRWPATEGEGGNLVARALRRYLDAVTTVATEEPRVGRVFSEVTHMLKSPWSLFYPRIVLRVLAWALGTGLR